ncbi:MULTISPECIES: cell division protein FtsL [Salinicola]|jgi:cell division protein FtsL|uniref:cell division protein FtsL n=1 Tax=Salinicola TaxID=404432 RepID=UPI000B4014E5|nr:cell division protein FtsL [Salinicola salarius]|tara:strand:- start:324 stop:656 length:333 start_codon:yes stop_codon:yes gene_type:complete
MAVQGRRRSLLETGDWPFARRPGFRATLLGIVTIAVLVTALAIISTSHLTRVQYARLQKLENQRDSLQTEWGRLLLEESTWSSPARIESLASKRLNMRVPSVDEVKVIHP